MNDWHVWAIATNRYKRVIEFLEEAIFVKDFLYPVAEKEYNTKKGRRKKLVPLYANYIFVKYDNNLNNHSILLDNPWIVQYVGPCSESELAEVRSLNNTSYEKLLPSKVIEPDTKVKMIRTPFAGWEAYVVSQKDSRLLVSIKIFGGERIIQCSVDDVNVIE